MTAFLEPDHYHHIGLLLLAGDVQAKVVANETFTGIEVVLEGGDRVIWTNTPDPEVDSHTWRFSRLVDDGKIEVGESDMILAASPDLVAEMIATFPYDAEPVEG